MSEDKQEILNGIPASSGHATGIVRIVTGQEDEDDFQENEILVTEITDPTMVMMMNRASGIICDIGGITSHPSILSRELGIACVVGTKEATKKLKTGDNVTINGTTGKVFLA